MAAPILLSASGQPLRDTAHEAASTTRRETASWNPILRSPDLEILPEWELMTSRTSDLIRNHGIASGAVTSHVDKVIGHDFRLQAKPDYRALGLSAEWADEWQRITEAKFRTWANDLDYYCDAGRRHDFNGLIAQAYRNYHAISNEMLATLEWLPRRANKYATAVNIISPLRLSNPNDRQDSSKLRGGVELGDFGEPVAYHFRMAYRDESWLGNTTLSQRWQRVATETQWGRRNVLHVFQGAPGQTRGKPGFASVIAKMKMLDRYQKATLQAAVINSVYAAVIESSLTHPEVALAMGGADSQLGGGDALTSYATAQAAFAQGRGDIHMGDATIPHLFPGEKLNLMAPQQPTAAFADFEAATLRHIAAGLNMSYEELTRDFTRTNYSSARASLMESWRHIMGQRHHIAAPFATQIYAAWLEEAIDRGDVEIPKGAPTFYDAKTAWCKCRWIAAPRGHIDEQKEMNARTTAYELGITTLEDLCLEQGKDYEEVIEQRAREQKKLEAAGLKPFQTRSPESRANAEAAADVNPEQQEEVRDAA